MKYCIWHVSMKKVAVNLGGQRLENLSKNDADTLMALIHPDIRELVEIRPQQQALAN